MTETPVQYCPICCKVVNYSGRYSTLFILSLLVFTSCVSIEKSPKYQFAEGYYKSQLLHKKLKQVYVLPGDDSIKIYGSKGLNRSLDTSTAFKIAFPIHAVPDSFTSYTFRHTSFDIDVLNILFKLRPATKGFPPQFNNNILNAAVFVGKRTDLYRLHYSRTPLGIYNRSIAHYGYSFGMFTGFGAARIDEYVTLNALSIQYDGLVNLSGVAVIIALDKLNFGVNAGFDHLLDRNRNVWIYQGKPWLGISFGLNLN